MLSSATACAPITAHNATGSVSNLAAFADAGAAGATTTTTVGAAATAGVHNTITTSISEQSRPLQGLAERFHGLTERLGSLGGGGSSAGHSRTESDASNRTRTGIIIIIIIEDKTLFSYYDSPNGRGKKGKFLGIIKTELVPSRPPQKNIIEVSTAPCTSVIEL